MPSLVILIYIPGPMPDALFSHLGWTNYANGPRDAGQGLASGSTCTPSCLTCPNTLHYVLARLFTLFPEYFTL